MYEMAKKLFKKGIPSLKHSYCGFEGYFFMKICTKCKQEKEIFEFTPNKRAKDGLLTYCRKCNNISKVVCKNKNRKKYLEISRRHKIKNKDKVIESNKIYVLNNFEKVKASKKKYIENNREVCRKRASDFYNKNRELCNKRSLKSYYKNLDKAKLTRAEYKKNNADKLKVAAKAYREKNKQILANKRNLRIKSDPLVRLKLLMRGRLRNILTYKALKRKYTVEKYTGISYDLLKIYIERQFKKGMTWDNNGNGPGKWHLDHKVPLASAKTEEEVITLFHYTNLQPLWSVDNLKKKDKILPTQLTIVM